MMPLDLTPTEIRQYVHVRRIAIEQEAWEVIDANEEIRTSDPDADVREILSRSSAVLALDELDDLLERVYDIGYKMAIRMESK